MEEIVVGIDVGTTKICTLVGRVEDDKSIRILGAGVEPSDGIRKGIVVDLAAASRAIKRSVEKAESTSSLEITTAFVSMAGGHVSSVNSRGSVGAPGGVIETSHLIHALEQAQAIAIPHDREIIHVIQRGASVDGQSGIKNPVGMHGYKLEVETHIVTAASAAIENLRQCVNSAGVDVQQFVLNPLASAEVTLTEEERQMGAAVCDIGGGTTDLAVYVDGDVWHTMALAVGGNHVTQDVAQGLRLSPAQAEDVKKQQGSALEDSINPEEYFLMRPFGEDKDVRINRQDLAHIIEARVEEMFELILQEIKRSGYDGLLPAGIVLTGGTSELLGIVRVASRVLDMPVRVGQPENLKGLVDKLNSPAYATSFGLLQWAISMHGHQAIMPRGKRRKPRAEGGADLSAIKDWMKRLLP
ncbi:MAG: cell division protein FtsA [Anaerolineales bacterium]|nr:cell division protein FtsA [Anaerolineales bacterium]